MSPRAAAFVVALLSCAPLASGDWLVAGHDAARTGHAEGRAPGWDDVALTVELPPPLYATAWDALRPSPLILDGSVYALIPGGFNLEQGTCYLTQAGSPPTVLYRVDPDSGNVQALGNADWPLYHLASDGERIFAVGHGAAAAWYRDGTVAWTLSDVYTADAAPERQPGACQYEEEDCGPPALADEVLWVACYDHRGPLPRGVAVVQGFRVADGARVWDEPWISSEATPPVERCEPTGDLSPCLGAALLNPASFQSPETSAHVFPPGVAVAAGHVFLTMSFLYVVDSSTETRYGGQSTFAINITTASSETLRQGPILQSGDTPVGWWVHAPPAMVWNEHLFLKRGTTLARYDAAQPVFGTSYDVIYDSDDPHGDLGSGLATNGDVMYAASRQGLFKLDANLAVDPLFSTSRLGEGEAWDHGPLVIAGETILARSTRPNNVHRPVGTTLHAFHAGTGELLWRHAFEESTAIAVSDGIIAGLGLYGRVTILGTTAAGIQPMPHVSTHYPSLDEDVVVDLSRTGPGLGGPPTAYRAVWGDGTSTTWGEDPVFRHRYGSAMDAQARFFARNDANQTASMPIVFHVGGRDPSLSMWNSPFHSDYQETTFFLLGLVLTGLLALFGVYRAGRKRRRLERELRELEAAYRGASGDTGRCEEILSERRARARALFLERRLEEAHASFLVTRVDELRQGLRMNEVEQRLDFLPHGMVKSLREMLRDTHITEWERTQFFAALERDDILTKRQKAQVRELIEGWFSRDTGAV